VCPFDVRWCSTFHENTWNCHNPQNQFTQTTNTWNMWNRRYCIVSSGFRRSTRSPVMERPIWVVFSTDILRRAIEQRLDRRAYEKVLRQERKIREEAGR
jgi:hypothetical protein